MKQMKLRSTNYHCL